MTKKKKKDARFDCDFEPETTQEFNANVFSDRFHYALKLVRDHGFSAEEALEVANASFDQDDRQRPIN